MTGPRKLDFPTKAVILSGGAGARLRPLTNDIPKGLVRVAGKPLLQWVIEWLGRGGITDLVVGVAYMKEKIIRHFGDGTKFGVKIRYSEHSVEGGTGEGFSLAIKRYVDDESFFAMNGDQVTDLDLRSMFKTHAKGKALATVAVVHPRLPFGLVITDENGYCRAFQEKPVLRNVACSSGIYLFQREISDYLPKTGDVEKTTFPRLAHGNRLKAYWHRGSFLTVNSIRELEAADLELKGKEEK